MHLATERCGIEESILTWTESTTVCIVHDMHLATVCCGVEESILTWTESATVYIVHGTYILQLYAVVLKSPFLCRLNLPCVPYSYNTGHYAYAVAHI